MSRFATIQKGRKARKTIECPAPLGAPTDYVPIPVDLVVLAGDEEADALRGADDYARSQGVAEPKEGNPHYDLGLIVHTLVRALVDHGEPEVFVYFFADEKESRDFDKMARSALSSFDREALTYLYQLQQVWQDECSPWGKGDTEAQVLEKIMRLRGVADPAIPFKMWRPATVGSLLLTMANQLYVLQLAKSPPGTASESNTTSSAKSADDDGAEPRRGKRRGKK